MKYPYIMGAGIQANKLFKLECSPRAMPLSSGGTTLLGRIEDDHTAVLSYFTALPWRLRMCPKEVRSFVSTAG